MDSLAPCVDLSAYELRVELPCILADREFPDHGNERFAGRGRRRRCICVPFCRSRVGWNNSKGFLPRFVRPELQMEQQKTRSCGVDGVVRSLLFPKCSRQLSHLHKRRFYFSLQMHQAQQRRGYATSEAREGASEERAEKKRVKWQASKHAGVSSSLRASLAFSIRRSVPEFEGAHVDAQTIRLVRHVVLEPHEDLRCKPGGQVLRLLHLFQHVLGKRCMEQVEGAQDHYRCVCDAGVGRSSSIRRQGKGKRKLSQCCPCLLSKEAFPLRSDSFPMKQEQSWSHFSTCKESCTAAKMLSTVKGKPRSKQKKKRKKATERGKSKQVKS